MAKKYSFKYPYASYMDVSLMRETKTRKELIAEYRAMQAEANRRLKALGKYKWMRESAAYERNVGKYNQSTFSLYHSTKQDIAKKMREAAIFLASGSSTVKGQRIRRDRLIETFHEEWDLTFINRGNVGDFARFLEAARAHYGSGAYTMDEVQALFSKVRKEKLDVEKVRSRFADFLEAEESGKYDDFKREASQRVSSDEYNA